MIRLPNFHENQEINAVRDEMGAYELGTLRLTRPANSLTMEELNELLGDGIDLPNLDDVKIGADGTIIYKNRRVVLYIRDVALYGNGRARERELPRYHVANCRTLDDMRAQRRFGRYVVAARSTGLFAINQIVKGRDPIRSDERLKICQNCLSRLRFDGFDYDMPSHRKQAIVEQFTLDRFFERYPHDVVSDSNADSELTARLNEYTGDFGLHATATKIRAGYRCEACGVALMERQLQRYLHAHHMNAIKYDNSENNLKALCIRCHAEEPGHAHMKTLPEYRDFITRRA